MARGDKAKERIVAKLKEAFGDKYLGENAKKYYILEDDNGEKVQICIALTCPKAPVEFGDTSAVSAQTATGDWDFTESAFANVPVTPKAKVTEEEISNIQDMMKRLGL